MYPIPLGSVIGSREGNVIYLVGGVWWSHGSVRDDRSVRSTSSKVFGPRQEIDVERHFYGVEKTISGFKGNPQITSLSRGRQSRESSRKPYKVPKQWTPALLISLTASCPSSTGNGVLNRDPSNPSSASPGCGLHSLTLAFLCLFGHSVHHVTERGPRVISR